MIVTITSCAPVRALSSPAIPAQIAPATMAAAIARNRCTGQGSSNVKPTQPAAAPATSICPRPPMLNMPARNARPTPRPAAISGAANLQVSVSGRMAVSKSSARSL